MSDITERLRARRVTRWVHATGQAPQASGYSADAECQEAADAIESRDATIAELRAQVEALRADAERWGWFRANYRTDWRTTGLHACETPERLEQHIDIARSQEDAR